MTTVAIESPYAACFPLKVVDHVAYARLAMIDSLNRGEAPFLSHLLYTQVLDDTVFLERHKGLRAGRALSHTLDMAAVYCDLGISWGMAKAIGNYRRLGKKCEIRQLFSPAIGRALRAGTMTLLQAIEGIEGHK